MYRAAILLLLIFSNKVFSINVGSITTYINSEQEFVSKQIENETSEGRFIQVEIEEISKPDKDGVTLNRNPSDILITPTKFILPAKSKQNVRFFYQGKKDNIERYYRIYWTESNLSASKENNKEKHAIATTSAIVGTILVVSPRDEKFNFEYTNGILKNIGNMSYRVVAYGPCIVDEKRSCKENYNDLPGKERKFRFVDIFNDKSFIGIWHGERFITVK